MEYLPQCIKKIPSHMDFEGQRQAERLFQVIIVVHGIVGFIAGYLLQQFSYTVYCLAFGFAICCLIVLPPWPQFRRHSLNWQKPMSTSSSSATSSNKTASSSVASKKKNK